MANTLSLFISFDGNCREALDYYGKVFRAEVRDLMTYGQMPSDAGHSVSEADMDRVVYSYIPIFGCHVMFCDFPADTKLTKGDNINPTLGSDDAEELRRIFAALADGGKVWMALEKTFWSELYGMVQDRYGIIWQLSLDSMTDQGAKAE